MKIKTVTHSFLFCSSEQIGPAAILSAHPNPEQLGWCFNLTQGCKDGISLPMECGAKWLLIRYSKPFKVLCIFLMAWKLCLLAYKTAELMSEDYTIVTTSCTGKIDHLSRTLNGQISLQKRATYPLLQ